MKSVGTAGENVEFYISVGEESPDSADAKKMMDELSDTLEAKTGSSGRGSFRSEDVTGQRALFVIARNSNGEAVGCGAIRPIYDDTAEVKRMYAKERGAGIGTKVLYYLEAKAMDLGYTALRLETRLINDGAVAFYEKRGYRRIPNYGRYIDRPEAVCFEKYLIK